MTSSRWKEASKKYHENFFRDLIKLKERNKI